MKIKSIRKIKLNKPQKFYDITVNKYHNFCISNSNIVVHNSSGAGAIVTTAQKFKNSMPLLEEIGQFGSLRSPEAGAPRYISTKLSKNFRKLYKDFELLTKQFEEGDEIEPRYFLPIVPTVLLNGTSGIAVGHATNILNREAKSLIDCCIKHLTDKGFREPKPNINEFDGIWEKDPDNDKTWISKGIFDVENTTTIKITELPPSMTYEKFEKVLSKLESDGLIVSYEDNCKSNIDYTIKMTRAMMNKMLNGSGAEKWFKLVERETENLTVLDERGKLRIFGSVIEIIKYFVDYRLTYYSKRKTYLLNNLNRRLKRLNNQARFIKMIIDGKLKINNVPKTKIEIQLEKENFDKIDDSHQYLLGMPIHTLTKEKYNELLNGVKELKSEIIQLNKRNPKDMYLEDLQELKKSI